MRDKMLVVLTLLCEHWYNQGNKVKVGIIFKFCLQAKLAASEQLQNFTPFFCASAKRRGCKNP